MTWRLTVAPLRCSTYAHRKRRFWSVAGDLRGARYLDTPSFKALFEGIALVAKNEVVRSASWTYL